jgi:hypothetical protein
MRGEHWGVRMNDSSFGVGCCVGAADLDQHSCTRSAAKYPSAELFIVRNRRDKDRTLTELIRRVESK